MQVGIDFGTSTSEIGFVDKNGRVTVIPNHLGKTITPSVVYFNEDKTTIIGEEALEKALLEPENTFLEIKRLFGEETQLTARKEQYTPIEIGSHIIRYLIECAKKYTNETIDSAIITVPAYFTDTQRKCVIEAGKLAGIEVSRIINEPTAASLDYGTKHMNDCKNLLVYDFGGGTLDVTVLELFEGVVEVKATSGNNALGGKDFDDALINYIVKSIDDKDKVNITQDLRAMMRIKMEAIACKIALSTQVKYEMELPFLYESQSGSATAYQRTFTRQDFDNLIKDLVYSTGQQINRALGDAGLTAAEIDLTLLVGGSTRTPLITKFLQDEFDFSPELSVDPDLAVVKGAAIQAGILSGVLAENAIILTDVCPHSLSTDVLVGDGSFWGGDELVCDILIPRNTTLPATVSKTYVTASDNQKTVRISAYQGEGEYPADNYQLSTFILSGIPKGKAKTQKITIQFEYDLNGILKVSSEIVSTGKSAQMTIDTTTVGEKLDLSEWKNSELVSKYRRLINKADRMLKLHELEDVASFDAALTELKKALVLNWDLDIIESLAEELQHEIEYIEEW